MNPEMVRESIPDCIDSKPNQHHTDPLDSIEEWLAMKRQTSRALGPPPEPLDVDQWFKAGPYRNDAGGGGMPMQMGMPQGYAIKQKKRKIFY